MNQWQEASLTNLGSVKRGRSRHRPRNDPRLFGDMLPFFQTGDVKAATLHMTEAGQYYSEFGVAQSRVWEAGITCITIAANIAESAVLGRRGCFPDSVLGFTPVVQPEDAYFVKYLLDVHRERLTSAARGTTQDNLSLEKLLAYRFPVPDPATRFLIAAVLRSLDELIENSRRRVEVLEEMARAIYREWFVHFRYPGHEDATFVDSPLGPIPEGWQVTSIGDVLELRYGKALKKEDRRGGSVAVVGSSGVVGWHDEELVAGPSVIVGRKGNVGSVTWVDGGSWPIDTTYYVVTDLPLRYVVEQLRNTEFLNTHAAVPGLSRDQAYSRPFLLPAASVIDQFAELSESLASQASVLAAQSERLASIRDMILPKLVTGQIDVSSLDLQAIVEEAAA